MLVDRLLAVLGVLLYGRWCRFLWCLWGERNDRSFDDRERTLEEIKSLFFNTKYLWTAAFISPLGISYHDFLFLFAFTD
jgi:hypothetical protein